MNNIIIIKNKYLTFIIYLGDFVYLDGLVVQVTIKNYGWSDLSCKPSGS